MHARGVLIERERGSTVYCIYIGQRGTDEIIQLTSGTVLCTASDFIWH